MNHSILNRLIAAKNLIESSGPALTRSSPPILLAQKLLAAHDAAELVLSALATASGAAPLGSDGQLIKDPTFMQLATAVTVATARVAALEPGPMQKTLQDVTEVRKLFKHRGLIVGVSENAHLFDETVTLLEQVTITLAGTSLLQITKVSAVNDPAVRDCFESAQRSIVATDFKESLERTADALVIALSWTTITVGKPSPEDALLLAGRGVDPSSFLSMQRILPLLHATYEEPEWDLRKFGHPFNWTLESAEFCFRTAVDLVIKLQNAPSLPEAVDFYDFYEDMLTVTVEEPEVFQASTHWFCHDIAAEKRVAAFRRGDVIAGKATGRFDRSSLDPTSISDFQFAEWIAVDSPRTERVPMAHSGGQRIVLWFKSNEVSLDYRINDERARMRDRLFRKLQE